MNSSNVVKSFFIGVGIGLLVLLLAQGAATLAEQVLTLLGSGAVGLLIGLATEWLTSLLPTRIARSRTYFFINNLIAIVITTAVMLVLVWLVGDDLSAGTLWWPLVAAAIAVVGVTNYVEYRLHRRTQARLIAMQNALMKADADDSTTRL